MPINYDELHRKKLICQVVRCPLVGYGRFEKVNKYMNRCKAKEGTRESQEEESLQREKPIVPLPVDQGYFAKKKGFFCRLCYGIMALLLGSTLLQANEPSLPPETEAEAVQLDLFLDRGDPASDRTFWVVASFDFAAPWHLYWTFPGDGGMAPQFDWKLPIGYRLKRELWPHPERFERDGMVSFGYSGPFIVAAEIEKERSLVGKEDSLTLAVDWVACSDETCMPGDLAQELSFLASSLPSSDQRHLRLLELIQEAAVMPIRLPARCNGQNRLEFQLPWHERSSPTQSALFLAPAVAGPIDFHHPLSIESYDPEQQLLTLSVPFQGGILPNSDLQALLLIEGADRHYYPLALAIESRGGIEAEPLAELTLVSLPGSSMEQEPLSLFEGGVLWAMLLAFAGGILLNLMPCVLPVISLKVFSFVKMAGSSKRAVVAHALAFTGGVVLSFWIVAAAMLAMQAYGAAVGWGFQLQEPLFVAVLAMFLFAFGLSMFGLFEVGALFAGWAGNRAHTLTVAAGQKGKLLSSFASGVMATAVATPCTGPFLGSAIGFAVTLPSWQAMSIFTTLALGMSLPYLLLAAFPPLLRFLPKPGPWMAFFKEFVGFIMMATVGWLLWVFSAQTGVVAINGLLGSFWLIAVACWIYGRFCHPMRLQLVRLMGGGLTLILFASAGLLVHKGVAIEQLWEQQRLIPAPGEPSSIEEWEAFDPARLDWLKKEGRPVFIDFTAKWCLICQANHLTLSQERVVQSMAERGVVKMKADWTKRDSTITHWLRQYGRSGVPLYLFFDEQGKVTLLPQLLTPETLIQEMGPLHP